MKKFKKISLLSLSFFLLSCDLLKKSASPSDSDPAPSTETPTSNPAEPNPSSSQNTLISGLASNAPRNSGSAAHPNLPLEEQTTSLQLKIENETGTYAGANLPTTENFKYRDIPKITKDDDGYDGFNAKYALRPQADCGITGTLEARIEECATLNGTRATWSGKTQAHLGQGTWKLVSRIGNNKEVWRDDLTKLLWTSKVTPQADWCKASGNTEKSPYYLKAAFNQGSAPNNQNTPNGTSTSPLTGNGSIGNFQNLSSNTALQETLMLTYNSGTGVFTTSSSANGANSCFTGGTWDGTFSIEGSQTTYTKTGICSFTITQGSVPFANKDRFVIFNGGSNVSCAPGAPSLLQPITPKSWCAEDGLLLPGHATENWSLGNYSDEKGRMGRNSSQKVRWRLPTLGDWQIALNNGIQLVMPDMGATGFARPLPDSSPGGNSNIADWTATIATSNSRFQAWTIDKAGYLTQNTINNPRAVRCVGR